MEELARTAGSAAAGGRVILAHLGAGASMAAVRGGTEHRHQHGLYAHGRAAHGDPLRRSRSGAGFVPGPQRAHDGRRVPRTGQPPLRAAGRLGNQRRRARPAGPRGERRRARPRPWPCSATRRRNGSARSPRPWAGWIRWCFPAGSASIRPRSAAGFAKACEFLGIDLDAGQERRQRPAHFRRVSRVAVHVIRHQRGVDDCQGRYRSWPRHPCSEQRLP